MNRKTGSTSLFGMILALIIGLGVMGYNGYYLIKHISDKAEEDRFMQHCEEIYVTVTDKKAQFGKAMYDVTVTYDYHGQNYSGIVLTDIGSDAADLEPGWQFIAYIDPENPSDCRLTFETSSLVMTIIRTGVYTFIGAVIVIGFFVSLFAYMKKRNRIAADPYGVGAGQTYQGFTDNSPPPVPVTPGFDQTPPPQPMQYSSAPAPAPQPMQYSSAPAPAQQPMQYSSAPAPAQQPMQYSSAPAPAQQPMQYSSATAPAPQPMQYSSAPAPAQQPMQYSSAPAPAQQPMQYDSVPAPSVGKPFGNKGAKPFAGSSQPAAAVMPAAAPMTFDQVASTPDPEIKPVPKPEPRPQPQPKPAPKDPSEPEYVEVPLVEHAPLDQLIKRGSDDTFNRKAEDFQTDYELEKIIRKGSDDAFNAKPDQYQVDPALAALIKTGGEGGLKKMDPEHEKSVQE